MDFSAIATTWALLAKTARIIILTEPERASIAIKIQADTLSYAADVKIFILGYGAAYEKEMRRLTEEDLLIVLLTTDGFMRKGYRERFLPFSKPPGCACKYIFIRLDIPEPSLLTGLNTRLDKVESIIRRYRALRPGKRVRVVTAKGTDITLRIAGQELLPCHARLPGGHAFLPPAEISEALEPASANGVIVADITVGELRFGPDLIDPLGLVDQPVVITVKDGLVADIRGGDIARRLQAGLNRLDQSLQTLVELGHGLSDLAPTGIIGIDESMNGTCHFGIGSRNPYHVDVVLSQPKITVDDKVL